MNLNAKEESIVNTYLSILNGLTLTIEDYCNIFDFYKAICLLGAFGNFSEEARLVASEEISNYIGKVLEKFEYKNDIIKTFITKYYELIANNADFKNVDSDEKIYSFKRMQVIKKVS